MPDRTRLRIVAKQKIIVCQLCKNEIENPSEAEACPSCRKIFHYAHLAEFVKTKGFCPACDVELSFLPDLPRLTGSKITLEDLTRPFRNLSSENGILDQTEATDSVDGGSALSREQATSLPSLEVTEDQPSPTQSEPRLESDIETINVGIRLSRPQKVGNKWACIRCNLIKKNLYKGGFCKLCFRVVKKQDPSGTDLLSQSDFEVFERDIQREQQGVPSRKEITPSRCAKCYSPLPIDHNGNLCSLCSLLDRRKSRGNSA
ncbi:MAG: hypothetical protein ACXACI_03800 [Candidatus Hodarchaeales archaeon]